MRLIGQYALKTASYEIQWFHIGAQHHSSPSCTLPLSIRLVSSFTSTVSFFFDLMQWQCFSWIDSETVAGPGALLIFVCWKYFKECHLCSLTTCDSVFTAGESSVEKACCWWNDEHRHRPGGALTSTNRPTWKRRGRSTISTFTGGTLYQRTSHVWLSLDMRGRAMGDCPLVDRSQMAFLWTYKILYFTITKMLKWIKWITKYICCPPK